jgi:pyruvate dehydrogenase (quinone)
VAKTTGDLLVERLVAWGVDTIFGFPGDGINGIFESLRTNQDKITYIQVRHEEAAAFAADGYARYTGRLGVCLATSGPGGIHLLNGLYDAAMDNQPVLAITGHTFHDLIGTHYQQDVDLDKLFMDVTVYNERVMGPHHVNSVVDEAIKAALSKRGVAHLTIPKDIQDWTMDDGKESSGNIAKHSGADFAPVYPVPPRAQLQQAADIINAGAKVAILAGRGCLTSRDEVIQLAELVGGPIVKPLLGKGVVPDRNPYTTGGIGLLGTGPSQEAMEECDTLIMLGTSYPYMEFLPKPGQAKCVQVDIDGTRIGLRHPVDAGLVGDCTAVLKELLPLVSRKGDRSFLETAQQRMKTWNELMEKRGTRDDVPMKPQVPMYHLNKYLDDDAIIACDCGTVTTWVARHIEMRGEMQFAVSGMLATMAAGLPFAVGAAVAYPGRQVVAIVGDGGFTMLMGELATMVKYNLPVKVFIIKNNTLGQIKWEQMVMEGNPEFGVNLQPIDFALYAKACGATGYCLDDPKSAESTIKEALAHPGPVVVECVVDANEPPLPGKIKTNQAVKFAEALIKGEGDRVEIVKQVAKDMLGDVLPTRAREVV